MKMKFAFLIGLLFTIASFNVHSSDSLGDVKIQGVDFHPSLMESISSGRKTATIRAGHRPYLRAGEAIARSKDGQTIEIEIERVFLTTYTWSEEAITTEILRRENLDDPSEVGFKELYEALKYYYKDLQYGDPVTVIFFHLKNPANLSTVK